MLLRNEFVVLLQKQIIPARCAAGMSRIGAYHMLMLMTSSCSCARGSLALWASAIQM